MVELYIEDRLVDLSGDEDIAIDYSISKISEFEKNSGALSVSFKLPKTANNRDIFENPDYITSTSNIPYSKLKARLYSNGIAQKISFCTIDNSNEFYNIRIYGDNVGFFDIIKNSNLTDLDLSEFDYYHLLDEVVSRRTDIDICFPIIWNFGTTPAIGLTDIRYQLPAFGVEYLLEKICEVNGYTLTNLIKDKYEYPSRCLILPFVRDDWKRDTNGDKYNSQWYSATEVASNPIVGRASFDLISTNNNYFNSSIVSGWNGYAVLQDKLQITYNLDITVDVTSDFAALTLPLVILILNGSTIIETLSIPYTSVSVGNNTFNISGTSVFTPEGTDECNNIYVHFYPTNDTINNLLTVSLVEATLTISDVVVLEAYDVNRDLSSSFTSRQFCTINSILPNIKQSDLFKAYCQIFCGLIQVDDVNKEVTLIPFDSVRDNTNDVIDWSNKLDFSEQFDIVFDLDKYAKVNTLDWKYDDTAKELARFVTDYAKGTIDINNANLDDEYKFVEIDFSATRMITKSGFNICQISVWDSSYSFTGEVERRLVFMKFNNATFNYSDGTNTNMQTTDIPFTYFIKESETHNLGFGDNLIEKFYGTLSDILNRTKVVTCLIRLSAKDINQLDFTKPVFIKHFNAYFYISQIKAYTPTNNESTMVELVKLF